MYIISKIVKILLYISIPFVILVMAIIPILINKISVKDNKIIISDNIIKVEDNKNILSISINGVKVADEADKDILLR